MMMVKIGDERVKAEDNITIHLVDGTYILIDGRQDKFLYINPNEVKMVIIKEKQSTINMEKCE